MNRSDLKGKSGSHPAISSNTNTRLSGSWLIFARVIWLVLVIPSLGLFVLGLPVYYQQLQRVCGGSIVCNNLPGVLTVKGLQALSTVGVSISTYAILYTIFSVLITAIWCTVGFLIYWRRSDDWLALLAAFFLVMSTVTISSGNPAYALALAYPVFALPFSLVSFLGQVSLGGFFLFFPNGRLIPRWMGLILLLDIIETFLNSFPSPVSPFTTNWPAWLYLLMTGAIYVSLLFSQIYRYRRVSTPLQRQQTKWIILGTTAVVAFYLATFVLSFLFPSLQNPNSSSGVAISAIVLNLLFSVVFLSIPLSIGFSILRYRLYDIDVLINRTLVYGTLTVLLALLYFGFIFVLQSLFQGVFHQNNAVAIVISTLAIAALFQPLRHRIQAIIDRRFYRRKYDAARTLQAFSTTLRSEVDLNQLSEHLVAVVQETMQPAQISLWLRHPQQPLKQDTRLLRDIEKEGQPGREKL
jgi:hypothetical protein